MTAWFAPTPTLRALRRAAEERLAAAGVDTPGLDARLLIGHALGLSREDLLVRGDEAVPPDAAMRANALVERRAAREPVGRILGERAFWTLDLSLSPATLEPRPDTETIVECVLDALPDRSAAVRILDLGTGTGCILLALLAELPNATGLGIDISEQAVATAAGNAARNGLAGRAEFRTGVWGAGISERFDAVVSNPPYIPSADIAALDPEVREHDPRRALDGGADGLDAYRAIAAELPGLLKDGGMAALEIGQGQAGDVGRLLESAGLRVAEIRPDLSGIERCIRAAKPV